MQVNLEHNSIVSSATRLQEQGFEVELLPVTKEGLIDLAILKNKIREDTILVSICTVDSEIGLKQPIEKIGEILKQYPNCHFHTDATQAIGKIPVDLQNVDLLTFAPHKFYGLPGIGVLIKKKISVFTHKSMGENLQQFIVVEHQKQQILLH